MPLLTPTDISYSSLAFLYVVLAFLAYKRIQREPAGRPWLIGYMLLSAAFLIVRAAADPNGLSLSQHWLAPDWAILLCLTLTFFMLTQVFFREIGHQHLQHSTLLGIGVLALLIMGAPLLPAQWFTIPWIRLGSTILALAIWIICYGRTAIVVRQKLIRARRQPLHRNRVAYWFVVTVLIAAADILFFIRRDEIGEFIRFAGVSVATYAVLALHLVDIQRLSRRFLGHLVAATSIGLLVLGVLGWAEVANYEAGTEMLLILIIVSAMLYQPTYRFVREVATRVAPHMVHQSGNWIVSEYSYRISKLLDLNHLEAEVVSLISKGMGLEHGTLFLVDPPKGPGDRFSFKSVQSSTAAPFILGKLDHDDPLALFLSHHRQPLTQFEIDVLPRFREGHTESRRWLTEMGIDVFVPIFLKDVWIGLLALGPKISGQPYDRYELDLLATIADQTAVALENARLFDNLVVLNGELQRALVELEDANARLQESDKLKSAFIGVVSHELRTPFANIGFSLNLIERYGTDSWPADQREELTNLHGGVEKARSMVEDLVTFATYLSKQGQLTVAQIDFPELMAEMAQVMEPLARQKGLQLRAGARSGDPFGNGHAPWVTGDRERLAEVIHHLVQNAIKFTPEEGLVDISYWTEADRAYVCVSDDGIGIPADKLDRIWEGFMQMADPVKRGTEGLGLGLPLVQYIVRAHGGDVWVESDVGAGSRFGFWVPLSGPELTASPAQLVPSDEWELPEP